MKMELFKFEAARFCFDVATIYSFAVGSFA